MKSFMEEYGKVVVVAIIIVALIVVACVFRDTGTKSIRGMLDNFLTQGDSSNIGGCNVSGDESPAANGVTIRFYVSIDSGCTNGHCYYSTDGGTTWIEAVDGATINDCTQIKLKRTRSYRAVNNDSICINPKANTFLDENSVAYNANLSKSPLESSNYIFSSSDYGKTFYANYQLNGDE